MAIIDVQFVTAARKFVGEIKVTGWLRIEQAFRVARGQLLEYAHLKFRDPVRLKTPNRSKSLEFWHRPP